MFSTHEPTLAAWFLWAGVGGAVLDGLANHNQEFITATDGESSPIDNKDGKRPSRFT